MKLIPTITSKLGTCQFCVRTALLTALGTWCAAWVSSFWNGTLSLALFTAAAALTLLWLSHLTAFGLRVVRHRQANMPERPDMRRREFFAVFARAVAFIAASSAIPALAGGKCPDGFYPCGNYGTCCANGRACVGNGAGCQ